MNKPQLVLVLILCVLTLVFYSSYDRYEFDGENLLKIDHFQADILCWEKECPGALIENIDQSVTRLKSTNGQEILSIRQTVNDIYNYQSLIFSYKLRTEGVIPGEQSWQTSHIIAIGIDAMGQKQFHEPHFLIKQHGTHDWEGFSKVIHLSNSFEKILVEVQLSRAIGTVWVKDISLRPVKQKYAYNTYWFIAVVSWVLVIAWVVVTYFQSNQINRHKVSIAILAIAVVIGGLSPYNIVVYINDYLGAIVTPLWSNNEIFLLEWTGLNNIYRQVHFWIFVLLSVIAYWHAASVLTWVKITFCLGLFAIVIEVLQMLVDGRNAELGDLFSDAGGIVFVLMIRLVIYGVSRLLTFKTTGGFNS